MFDLIRETIGLTIGVTQTNRKIPHPLNKQQYNKLKVQYNENATNTKIDRRHILTGTISYLFIPPFSHDIMHNLSIYFVVAFFLPL